MSLTDAQQADHQEVMATICHAFRQKGLPMVLKGGTALNLCYDLDRFSENLAFDCAKALKLETSINEVFTYLGKGKAHLRHPEISVTKDTKTVKCYRIIYADNIHLNLEISLRDAPIDADLIELNGILTYKVGHLIDQKLSALNGRTTARDLHDVFYLYCEFFNDFNENNLAEIQILYETQSTILDRFEPAYDEDTLLSSTEALDDLMAFIELYEERSA